MPDAVMKKTEGVDELLSALILNEQSRQLTNAVEGLRGAGNEPAARSLVRYADYFCSEVRERVRKIIREHPEGYPVILSLLRTVLEWLNADRSELRTQGSDSEAAQKLKDIDHFEAFVRDIGRDILRQSWTAR